MVRRILLALLAIAAAPAAWYLRGQQLLAADGAERTLPLSSAQLDWALWGLLAALALLTLLLALPERKGKSLAELHTVALGAILQGAGALLLTGGAALRLYGLYPDLRSWEAVSAAVLLLGALGLLIGGLRIGFGSGTRGGGALLLTMCAAAVELVLCYRAHAADPELHHYAITLLTLAAATLAAALLAGFAFGMGGRRRFLLFAGLTAALSAASLHAAASYDEALCFMGCAAAALGLFLSLLFGVPLQSTPRYELEPDPFHLAAPPAKPPEAEPCDADAPAVAAMAPAAAKVPAADPAAVAAATVADALSAPEAPAAPAAPPRAAVTVEKNVTAAVPVITVPAAASGAGNGTPPTIDVILRVSIPVSDLTSAIPTVAVTADPGAGGKPAPAAEAPAPEAVESPVASDDAPVAAPVAEPLPTAVVAEAPAPATPEPPVTNTEPSAPATEAVVTAAPVPDAPPAAEAPDSGAVPAADEVPADAAAPAASARPAPEKTFDLSQVDRLLRGSDAE